MHRVTALGGLMLAIGFASACARPVARQATPGAIEGAVGALSEPDLQEQIADIAADPEVQRAAENVIATATDGVIAALSEEERRDELATLTGQYMGAVSTALARSMGRDLTPEVHRLVAGSVDASIREIASERNIARIEQLSAGLTDSVLRGMMSGLQNGVGPEAMHSIMRDAVRPGLIGLLDEDLNQALGVTAYEISRQAVLGAEAGLAGRHRADGFLRRWFLAGPGAIVAWLLLVALLVGAILLALFARRQKRESERREAALLSIAEALKASEDRPWAPELRESLREQLRDRAGADYVREVLRKRPDLRMQPRA